MSRHVQARRRGGRFRVAVVGLLALIGACPGGEIGLLPTAADEERDVPVSPVAPGPRGPDPASAQEEAAATRFPPPPRPADMVDVSEIVAAVRAGHDVPALGGGVVEGAAGGLVARGVDGKRARGEGVPVTVDDLWHLGSCTKAMTATLAARLAERGRLELSDTLSGLFPDIEVHDTLKGATLERLFAHRAGFPKAYPRPLWQWLWKNEVGARAQRARIAARMLTSAPPEEPGGYVYSNMGFDLAGAAMELREDLAFEDLMLRELFRPLAMRSAGFGPPGLADEVDQPHGHRLVGDLLVALPPGPGADNPPALSPAGRAHMDLADWGRFIALHLVGARQDIRLPRADGTGAATDEGEQAPRLETMWSRETIRRLHQAAAGETYAYGWVHTRREWAGGRVLMHAGSNNLWYCVCWLAPERDFAVLATCNAAGARGREATDALAARLIRWRAARQGD